MSAKFPRGGGANPFSAIRLITNKNDPQKKHRLGTVSKNIFTGGFRQFHGANLTLNSDVDQDA